MMKFLVRVDTTVLRTVERFGHWTQRTFGVACSDWIIIAEYITVIMMVIDLLHQYPRWIVMMLMLLLVGLRLGEIKHAIAIKKHMEDASASGCSNELKIVALEARLIFLGMLLIALPMLDVYSMWIPSMVLKFYFQCCDNLPPGESKARKLINSLRAWRISPATNSI